MGTPLQGQDILVWVNIGSDAVPNFVELASQRNASFQSQTPTIDVSGKQDAASVFTAGRTSDQCTVESLYVPGDAAWAKIKSVQRTRQNLAIQRYEEGTLIETGVGIITNVQETAQDQQGVTCSATFQISGGWIPA